MSLLKFNRNCFTSGLLRAFQSTVNHHQPQEKSTHFGFETVQESEKQEKGTLSFSQIPIFFCF